MGEAEALSGVIASFVKPSSLKDAG